MFLPSDKHKYRFAWFWFGFFFVVVIFVLFLLLLLFHSVPKWHWNQSCRIQYLAFCSYVILCHILQTSKFTEHATPLRTQICPQLSLDWAIKRGYRNFQCLIFTRRKPLPKQREISCLQNPAPLYRFLSILAVKAINRFPKACSEKIPSLQSRY